MLRIVMLLAGLLVAIPALAQSFPQSFPARPVRLIVPFPPGGGGDLVARAIAPRLQELWGQPVVVDNRAGGSAMIGMDAVAKAPPDGYTIGIITLTHGINASLFPKAPYDLVRDIAPLSICVHSPMLVVTHPALPASSLGELTTLLRTKRFSAPSSGNGSPPHIGLELYRQIARFDVVHVPYKGGAPSMVDLIAGRTDFAVSNLVESIQHVKAGKLRAIAIPSEERHPLLPEVPTTAEAGLPEFRLSNWVGLVTSSAVPRDLLAAMSETVQRAVRSPDVTRRLLEIALTPVAMPLDTSQRFMTAEVKRWGELIRAAGIQPD